MSKKMLTEELVGYKEKKNLIELINEGDKKLESYCQNVLSEILRISERLFEWVDIEKNLAEKII